jgi:hypothetical protein
MSDKYCSAGKIECEVYSLDNSASGYCQASFVDRRWEQCPWPSRQRPVEKAGDMIGIDFAGGYEKGKIDGINKGVERAYSKIDEILRKLKRYNRPEYRSILEEHIAACRVKP